MNRSTKLLIAFIVVLVAIVYFLLPSDKEREASYKPQAISINIDSGSVVKIEMKRPTEYLVIENVGGNWKLTSPVSTPADPSAILSLLNGLSKFTVGSLISSNQEKQRLFQVDSSGTKLTITERSGKVTSMIIGKMGPSFSELYFRLPDSKDVYLGSGIDTWIINKNVKEWRDKSILHANAESIREISINAGGKTFDFLHDTAGWKSGEKAVESNEINPMLNSLADLRADDFVDSAVDITSNPIKIDIKAAENISLTLFPKSPETLGYYARSSKTQQMYVISKSTADQLLKPTGKTVAPAKPQVAEIQKKKPITAPKKVTEVKPVTPVQQPITKKDTTPSVKQPSLIQKKEIAKTPPVVQEKKEDSVQKSVKAVPEQKIPPAPDVMKKTVQPAQPQSPDEDGELIIHTVKAGETMTTIAKKYNVSIEQILKWNLRKSIAVKPGQELYIYKK